MNRLQHLACWSLCVASACSPGKAPADAQAADVAPGVRLLGRIQHPLLTESSGVVMSRRHAGTFWTHNDGSSRKREALYAIDRSGRSLAVYRVDGPRLTDWEDIAIDDQGHLYIGDIGNNDCNRDRLAVHLIDEPDPQSREAQGIVKVVRSWDLRFPDQPFDCESLFVHRDTGYVISKVRHGRNAELLSFPLAPPEAPIVLTKVCQLPITSPATGADLSPDGRLLAVVAHSGAYLFHCDEGFAALATARPFHVPFAGHHVEGCCFTPDGLLATAESREIYLFTDPRFRGEK
jgi:hypothetical protein